jgi:hypothetical protein
MQIRCARCGWKRRRQGLEARSHRGRRRRGWGWHRRGDDGREQRDGFHIACGSASFRSVRLAAQPWPACTVLRAQSLTMSAEHTPSAERPRKRARSSHNVDDASRASASNARLFAPFRALGLVTNFVPFVLQTRSNKGATEGPRVHILTCLGRSWALWEGGKMGLLFVGAPAAATQLSGRRGSPMSVALTRAR